MTSSIRFQPSLKTQFGIGAALLGGVALVAAWLVIAGLQQVSGRIHASLAAEHRIDRYSVLSTQVSRFLVVATEAVQSGVSLEERGARLTRLEQDITATFAGIGRDLEQAVAEAAELGLDEQSRRGTTGLAVARMQAQFNATRAALVRPGTTQEALQGYIDLFTIGFDPNLNAAITDEVRTRDRIRDSIDRLTRRLTRWALGLGALALMLVALGYLRVIRPQFRRLDLLQDAARRIGAEDFSVALPEARRDEIGRLFRETNRMAEALAARKTAVEAEWAHLNETIARRTEDLRTANAALARQDRDRRRFFADVSHELRTPLTVISTESQIGQGHPDAETRAAFTTIRNRAERLNRRIDDLLRVARSESGQLELTSEAFDLSGITTEAIAETRAEAESAGLSLSLSAPEVCACLGDANWVRQMTAGVIRNAIRHARAGGRIAVQMTAREAAAQIAVIDNGPGIAASDQAAMFERFARGHDPEPGGFGIGLALTKWVMEAQGGTVHLQSPVPDDLRIGDAPGLCVCLGLPRVPG